MKSKEKIPFGSKIIFKNESHCLYGKELCCVGICKNAIAVIEWENRGGYNFDFYTVKDLSDIEVLAQ
ncbi:MAG: hypothetical protein WCY19_05105 [Candidatus Gastranaerophilaceae bacterium]